MNVSLSVPGYKSVTLTTTSAPTQIRTRQLSPEIIDAAAYCGIDASQMSLAEIKAACAEQVKQFGDHCDQHLARLQDEIKRAR